MMLPPPCLTVGSAFSGSKASRWLLQTSFLSLCPVSSTFVLSDHQTFLQTLVFQHVHDRLKPWWFLNVLIRFLSSEGDRSGLLSAFDKVRTLWNNLYLHVWTDGVGCWCYVNLYKFSYFSFHRDSQTFPLSWASVRSVSAVKQTL